MEEIWLSPLTKVPIFTEKSKKQLDNTKTPIDYITIADRLKANHFNIELITRLHFHEMMGTHFSYLVFPL